MYVRDLCFYINCVQFFLCMWVITVTMHGTNNFEIFLFVPHNETVHLLVIS
jgi:hypothetical protein